MANQTRTILTINSDQNSNGFDFWLNFHSKPQSVSFALMKQQQQQNAEGAKQIEKLILIDDNFYHQYHQ